MVPAPLDLAFPLLQPIQSMPNFSVLRARFAPPNMSPCACLVPVQSGLLFLIHILPNSNDQCYIVACHMTSQAPGYEDNVVQP